MHARDYLVIDLEATCDDKGAVPKREMEIIEIGAVLVDGEIFEPIAEFQRFVRPLRHPKLTPFCTRLTSITQAEVDAAQTFPAVLTELREFMAGSEAVFASWGKYDHMQFRQDAAFHGVKLPFRGQHLNIKEAFSAAVGTTKRFGMAGALRRLGLPLEGTHHRGIDDARNIARILPYAVGAQVIPG
ncbi:exonuclease domain-containing protein [Pseudenhygromyxa sp. WMMC2535]|nr:exonuclease domain-containing protein [Pseudenhygromyxa sp. WMMC2535]NVB43605.1 exonuclease domain-containing protein [Pseudenhygromyxa sp. WMMC2535]